MEQCTISVMAPFITDTERMCQYLLLNSDNEWSIKQAIFLQKQCRIKCFYTGNKEITFLRT